VGAVARGGAELRLGTGRGGNAPDVVGELIAGRYELEELVGTGGMSSVFRAHDRLLDRNVALKILHERYSSDDDYVERFRHEARAAAQLGHPNIVTVIDRGEQDGRQFIVFEYCDGETLKELIQRRGPLPVREAVEIALQVATALSFAHGQGLVHRDVKPQNVLFDEHGRAKVTDFGIARSLDVEQGITQTGTVLGTSSYIAPEQARGERVDALTDVYSLGAVLYELLTGQVPYDGDNFVAVAMKHINDPVPSIVAVRPDVPLRLDSAVGRAMAKRPEDRFQSMEDFAGELRTVLRELGPDGTGDATMIKQAPVIRQSRRRVRRAGGRRRRVLPLVLLAVAVAAVAFLVGLLIFKPSSSSTGTTTTGTTRQTPPAAVHLRAAAAYDPSGDGHEHDEDVPKATDGNPTTYWQTEHYRSFQKPGVGLVLDAGKTASPAQITVFTTLPGYTAEIQAGDSPTGPFHKVSPSQTVGRNTTFDLAHGTSARYFLVWITKLAGEQAFVNEVKSP
jgi:eukaryotic-like serine/threonine-protein kinase